MPTSAASAISSHLRLARRVRSAIHEQEILHGVVGDEQVHAAVVVDVGGDHAEPFAEGLCDVGARGPLR